MQATEAMTPQSSRSVDWANARQTLRLQRNLKIVVIALAVLIFAGLATIVGRVIYLASGAPTQPAAPGWPSGRSRAWPCRRGRRCVRCRCRAIG